jgi:hypothetical protein
MPALSNYNPSTLAAKLQEISSMLDLQPQQLGPALCAAPRVLGWSLLKVERHLESLLWIQPDRALLAQVGTARHIGMGVRGSAVCRATTYTGV